MKLLSANSDAIDNRYANGSVRHVGGSNGLAIGAKSDSSDARRRDNTTHTAITISAVSADLNSDLRVRAMPTSRRRCSLKDGTATIPEPIIIAVANSFFIVLLPFVRIFAAI